MKLRGIISIIALLCCFGAYAAPMSARFAYGLGKTELKEDYRGNSKLISQLDRIVADGRELSGIEVVGVSSPDGSLAANGRLAQARANALVDYLKERYSLPDSVFVIKTVDEDWKGVENYLRRSDKPWKDEALKIVTAGRKNRKEQLKELWVGEAWDDLMTNLFPRMRYAELHFEILESSGASAGEDRIQFSHGYRKLDKNKNASILKPLQEKIEGGYTGIITLTGYSSPDGSTDANQKLSLARAQSVKNYLVSELGYPEEKIEVRGAGEDWDGFASAATYSYYGSDRDRVLEIFGDQNLTPAQKKRALVRLDGGNTWRALKSGQMLLLRSVEISF